MPRTPTKRGQSWAAAEQTRQAGCCVLTAAEEGCSRAGAVGCGCVPGRAMRQDTPACLQWRIIPGAAFPTARWTAGSGSLYCDGGSFCPNTTTRLDCPRSHFCRQGTVEPARCPPGVSCPPTTEIPDSNYTGGRGTEGAVLHGWHLDTAVLLVLGAAKRLDVTASTRRWPVCAGITVDAAILLILGAAYLVSQRYNRVLLQLSARERLKITWGAAPEIMVVRAAPRARTPTPTPGSRSRTRATPGATAPAAAGRGLPGMLARRRAGHSAAGKGGGQVWAAFRGPEAEAAAAGYAPLLDEQHLSSGGGAGEAVELSQAGGGSPDTGSPVGTAAAGGTLSPSHARLDSIDNEDEMTPRHLHTRLVAPHRQSLLSSPLSSIHAGTGEWRGQDQAASRVCRPASLGCRAGQRPLQPSGHPWPRTNPSDHSHVQECTRGRRCASSSASWACSCGLAAGRRCCRA